MVILTGDINITEYLLIENRGQDELLKSDAFMKFWVEKVNIFECIFCDLWIPVHDRQGSNCEDP